MNIDDFRYIATIAELGSFTKAAKKMFIAQPSLSQRVKHIEDVYNIIIFIRDSKKGIYLTEEGKIFVKYAKKILRADADLQRELNDIHDQTDNILRIGTSQLISASFFDQIILRFHEKNPEVHFEFIQETSTITQNLLLKGEIDIGICYAPIISDALDAQIILDDRMVLVPAKDSELARMLEADGIRPGDRVDIKYLNEVTFASGVKGMKMHDFIKSLPEKYDVIPDIQHYSKSYHSLYTIACAGIASTLLMESFFSNKQDSLPYYYLDCEETELSIAVVWSKNAYMSQLTKKFIDIAQDVSYEIENELVL